jgi:molybdenum cofactor cytidylyltransferase
MGLIRSIILAAGESKRMGFPKMLLAFNGKTMIENVIEHVAESESSGNLVVLGANREKLTDIIGKYNVSFCYNENYRQGMLSSVQCGMRNLPGDTGAVLVFQGDQPFITPGVINSVIRAYRSSGKGIVIPACGGKRGHPLLLDNRYMTAVDDLDPQKGLREIIERHSDDVFVVETGEPGILRDFDTFEDYMEQLNQTK